jgi:hypothetical protein
VPTARPLPRDPLRRGALFHNHPLGGLLCNKREPAEGEGKVSFSVKAFPQCLVEEFL